MALNALSLTVTSGIQGRAFKSAVNGRTAGTVVEVTDGATQGFGYSNGFVYHAGLPYDLNVVELRERVLATGEALVSRVLVTSVTEFAVKAQALASTAMVRGFRSAGVVQSDGSIAYSLFVEDASGNTATLAVGGGTLPPPPVLGTLTLSGSLQIGTAASLTISGTTPGSAVVSNVPGMSVSGLTLTGTPTGSAGSIANGLVETLAGAVGSPRATAVTVAAASGGGLTYDPALTAQQLTLANGLSQFPPQLTSRLNIDATVGVSIRLQVSTTFPVPDDAPSFLHTVSLTDQQAGAFSWGTALSSITNGTHYFRERLETATTYGDWCAVVMHGDANAPAMTGSFTGSSPELQAMAFAVSTSKPSTLQLGGVDAAKLELASNAAGMNFVVRLLNNALLDFDSGTGGQPSLNFSLTPTDLAGQLGQEQGYVFNIVDVDDTPDDDFNYTNIDSGASASTLVSPAQPWVIHGLGSGVQAIVSVGGSGVGLSKNGAAVVSGPLRAGNGDTISPQLMTGAADGTYAASVMVGTLAKTFHARVGAAVAAFDPSAKGNAITLSNNNKTAACTGDNQLVRFTKRVAKNTGKYYFEVSFDAISGSGGFQGGYISQTDLTSYNGAIPGNSDTGNTACTMGFDNSATYLRAFNGGIDVSGASTSWSLPAVFGYVLDTDQMILTEYRGSPDTTAPIAPAVVAAGLAGDIVVGMFMNHGTVTVNTGGPFAYGLPANNQPYGA